MILVFETKPVGYIYSITQQLNTQQGETGLYSTFTEYRRKWHQSKLHWTYEIYRKTSNDHRKD